MSSCPRCALPVGPFADLRGGCAACRDRSLGFDSAIALGPYDGALRDLCLRGYNQAEALASGLARRLRRPVRHRLRRVTATERLANKGQTERADIMHGAFRARAGGKLTGRTVLLVDDVLTTGATCSAAARALKKAGAARVIVVVIARAERKTL
jgi:predicted amidophosphoribosyltransferase